MNIEAFRTTLVSLLAAETGSTLMQNIGNKVEDVLKRMPPIVVVYHEYEGSYVIASHTGKTKVCHCLPARATNKYNKYLILSWHHFPALHDLVKSGPVYCENMAYGNLLPLCEQLVALALTQVQQPCLYEGSALKEIISIAVAHAIKDHGYDMLDVETLVAAIAASASNIHIPETYKKDQLVAKFKDIDSYLEIMDSVYEAFDKNLHSDIEGEEYEDILVTAIFCYKLGNLNKTELAGVERAMIALLNKQCTSTMFIHAAPFVICIEPCSLSHVLYD